MANVKQCDICDNIYQPKTFEIVTTLNNKEIKLMISTHTSMGVFMARTVSTDVCSSWLKKCLSEYVKEV